MINLYGVVSYDTICFVIYNTILNKNYLDEMQFVADKYFNKRIGVVLSFNCKYQNLSSKIFKLDVIDVNVIRKIYELSIGDVLDEVDLLSVEEFLECDIKDFSYSFKEKDYVNDIVSISPISFKTENSLYKYYRELAKIDSNGNWEEYLASNTHDDTLKEMYDINKEGMELLYEVNILGDIVFVIENAGLIIWLPPIMTKVQRDKLLEKLEILKNRGGVDIFLGVANPNVKGNYIYLNNGMSVNVEMAIDSVGRIRIEKKAKLVKKIDSN